MSAPLNQSVNMDEAGDWTTAGGTLDSDSARALLGTSSGLGFSVGMGMPGLGPSLAQQAAAQQPIGGGGIPGDSLGLGQSTGWPSGLGLSQGFSKDELDAFAGTGDSAMMGDSTVVATDDMGGHQQQQGGMMSMASGSPGPGSMQLPASLIRQPAEPSGPPAGFNQLRESGGGEPSQALQSAPAERAISAAPADSSADGAEFVRKVLDEASQLLQRVITELEEYRVSQSHSPLPLDAPTATGFFQRLAGIEELMRSFSARIDDDLLNRQYLEPAQIQMCLQLNERSIEYRKLLELYTQELQSVADGNPMVTAALCITGQPYPESVKQDRPVEEPTFVKLLTGARVEASNPQGAVVTATVLASGANSGLADTDGASDMASDGASGRKRKKTRSQDPPIGILNNQKPMNDKGVAIFDGLKFPNGSRLKSIRLKFAMSLPSLTLESPPTEHIVVKTNENQWWEAEGILLKKFCFKEHAEVPWFRLANLLQWRYIRASRQSPEQAQRPLTTHDFDYLCRLRFSSKLIVTQREFEQFWEWFGPLMHKIRYQRHLCPMWLQGFVCGFLTRDEVEHVLAAENVGTFLIRVSERVPGRFAVAYVAQDTMTQEKEVKHYLVKDDDTAGAKKTLPDFLGGFPDLKVVLQLWTNPHENKRVLGRCAKDEVLKDFYSKRKPASADGYDEQIQVNQLPNM